MVDCLPSDRDIGDGYSEADGSDAFVAAERRSAGAARNRLDLFPLSPSFSVKGS